MPDLDDRIRNLVASAVADAPTAPELAQIQQVTPVARKRPSWPKWTAALAALLAAGGATVALQPAHEGDVDTRDDTTPTTAVAPVPQASVIVTAGPDGVREIVDGETRVITTEPMVFALELDDGSVVAQRRTSDGRNVEGGGWTKADTVPLLFSNDGTTTSLLDADALDGNVVVHDFSVVDGRRSLLYGTEDVSSKGYAEDLFVLDLDTKEPRSLGRVGHQGAGVSRLSLASSGLIVGTDEGGGGLLALAVPGSPAAAEPLPKETDFWAGERSNLCRCPRGFAVDADGTTLYWLAPAGSGTVVVSAPLDDLKRVTDVAPAPASRSNDDPLYSLEIDPGDRGVVVNFGNRYAWLQAPLLIAKDSSTTLQGSVATVGPNG